ncbi:MULTISPECIES: NUDIX hydrolase [unclassified Leptolyngbya]|uniref:NUDIX hydrolase n=1 Tax=unclassified Leptolyngbya TaxID=2650499 RepID=UPI001683E9FA|nr:MULTISPECIES: NUDIX hydrolase [unclassified Leptolyngbya]MBD1912498.1 NUDIX hydrolase [Leptolyngbya sp. FACHB-8]MBD2156491.1 NUDIX hydrolase [Leptolyngbya sp. FACHB-16]
MAKLSPIIRQRLAEAIQHHIPANEIEASHQDTILQLIETCDDPLDRDRYSPGHITASAWVVAVDTRQVGLIFHKGLQRWLQPGGHVDPGETDILAAALREVAEEMGLAVASSRAQLFDVDVHPIPARPPYPTHQHFDIRYLCLTESQPIVPATDVEQGRWFSIEELTPDILDSSMQRMLDKCFSAGIL